jgi:TonB family protein
MSAPSDRNTLYRRIGAGLIALLVVVALGVIVWRIASGPASLPKRTVPDVVQLRLVPPPPPPPPPPPQQPKLIEPPKVQQQQFKAEQPMPDNKPPSPHPEAPPGPPALEGPGQGAPDGFGLAGGGNGSFGGGDGGGGSRFGWYAQLIKSRAQESLQKQRRLNGHRYRVNVQLWLASDGTTQRVELISSTGKTDIDQMIREALGAMPKLPEPPPPDMPEPVVMEVSSS